MGNFICGGRKSKKAKKFRAKNRKYVKTHNFHHTRKNWEDQWGGTIPWALCFLAVREIDYGD